MAVEPKPERSNSVASQTTFGKSAHRAPHMSLRFFACFRGRSAVISFVQSNSLAPIPQRPINPMKVTRTPTPAFVALDVEHLELADYGMFLSA